MGTKNPRINPMGDPPVMSLVPVPLAIAFFLTSV